VGAILRASPHPSWLEKPCYSVHQPTKRAAFEPAQAQEGPMTVFVYVDTSKQVGDKDHLGSLQMRTPLKRGFKNTTLKAWHLK
jgi:hypothetical protein